MVKTGLLIPCEDREVLIEPKVVFVDPRWGYGIRMGTACYGVVVVYDYSYYSDRYEY